METKPEFVYPRGYNWEGLTPSQVNQGYEQSDSNQEMEKLQQVMKDEPGVEVRLEILGQEDSNHPEDCKGCPDCPGKWVCKCGLEFDELNTEHECQK